MSSATIDNLLAKLEGVREHGGRWMACCPSHDDNTASLSVGVGNDGRALLRCQAGCKTVDVVAAIGLTMADLFPSDNGNGRPQIVATYDYHDRDGTMVYQSVRYSDKTFKQRRPDGNGGWVWSVKAIRRVLYRLPELLKADTTATIFVCEGEKDVDRLRSLGLVATTNVGGSKQWKAGYGEYFTGRQVVALPDNDTAGHDHGQDVAQSCQGVAASVKVIELPGLADKQDVSDWLDAGGTVEKLRELVEVAPEWFNQPMQNGRKANTHKPPAEKPDARGDTIRFKGVTCAELDAAEYEIEFLIDDTLVASQPLLMGGAEKTLKTLLAVDAALSLATATPFLGTLPVERAISVGFMSGEGGLPVLQDYARRVAESKGLRLGDVGGLVFEDQLPQLSDLRHLDALGEFILDRELEAVFLDPLYLCMPGDDAGNMLKQGKILGRLNEVCTGNGCTPLLLHHTKKGVVDPYAPAELPDLAWSGFSAFAGQWWLVSRREKYDPDRPGDHKLWFNVGGRAGHSALHALDIAEDSRKDVGGRRWEVEVKAPRDAREAADDRREEAQATTRESRLERDKQKICNAMAKFPAGETSSIIRDVAGLKASQFKAALAELLQADDVVPVEVQKSNRKTPYDGYKLAE